MRERGWVHDSRGRLAKRQGLSALPTRMSTRGSLGREKSPHKHRDRPRPLGRKKLPAVHGAHSVRASPCGTGGTAHAASHAAPQVPQKQVAPTAHHCPSTEGAHRDHRPGRVPFATATGVTVSQRPSQQLPLRQHGGQYCPSADSNKHQKTRRAPPPPPQRRYDGAYGKLPQKQTQEGREGRRG